MVAKRICYKMRTLSKCGITKQSVFYFQVLRYTIHTPICTHIQTFLSSSVFRAEIGNRPTMRGAL